ncbi:MAG: GNAT family N-acetyltransferase [Thermomicrobiales bacterium]|nr:GNAT family N-acetyltransferase [Thermomicrobiales bacterium]
MSSVSLRPVTVEDAEHIYAWRSEPSIAHYQPLRPISLDEVRAMVTARSQNRMAPDAFGDFQWIILSGDQPAGWISLKIAAEDRAHAKGSIGYALGEAFRGRGIGRAAVGALLPIAYGADGFNLERLEAVAAVGNIASRRVLEGNGFRFEGIQRGLLIIRGERIDHAMYGQLRSDREE